MRAWQIENDDGINALKLANGESIPDNIDTGTVLVTKENAADFM